MGNLGQPDVTDPKLPSTTGLANIVSVTAGLQHACALSASGATTCWGYNEVGELGNGDHDLRSTPTPVKGIAEALAIGSGNRHSCAILKDHTLRCWGSNEFGGLGLGDHPKPATDDHLKTGHHGGDRDVDAGRAMWSDRENGQRLGRRKTRANIGGWATGMVAATN
jgi:alpha-tubulin suppressor-like RCC1 family protein